MENIVAPDVQAEPVKPKKIVERSASYPGISIPEALIFVSEIQEHFPGTRLFKRDDAVAVLKTSAINRDIAAAKEYGFLVKVKDSFQVTELYKVISNHLSQREKRKCLLEAFASPKLYREIISKQDGHAIPSEFKIHLIRFHKIVDKAAQFAADIFVENGKFVGAINEHGILNYKEELAKVSNPNIEYAEVITEENQDSNNDANVDKGFNQQQIDITPEQDPKKNNQIIVKQNQDTVEEKIKIPLTEKKYAALSYPTSINRKDLEILRKQIELLELLIT